MNDIDMSRPGSELFSESVPVNYNSYMDVNQGQAVGDPLNSGVSNQQVDAGQAEQMSDKEMNFKALRDVVSTLKEEREYWKGQAEAYSRNLVKEEPSQADAYAALDWNDGGDVRKAFDSLREQNDNLRMEVKNALKASDTRSKHSDWDNMVTQHVPKLTSENPIFAEMIRNTSNPAEAAYLLASLNARASGAGGQTNMPQPAPAMNPNAQRAMQNAQKPQSLASVGGNSTLSAADYYATMTDAEFMDFAGRNLANI